MASVGVMSSINHIFKIPSRRSSLPLAIITPAEVPEAYRDDFGSPEDQIPLSPTATLKKPEKRHRSIFPWRTNKAESPAEEQPPNRNLTITHPTDVPEEHKKEDVLPKLALQAKADQKPRRKSTIEFSLPNKSDFDEKNGPSTSDNDEEFAPKSRRQSLGKIKWLDAWKGKHQSLNEAGREALKGRRKSGAPGKRTDSAISEDGVVIDHSNQKVETKDFALLHRAPESAPTAIPSEVARGKQREVDPEQQQPPCELHTDSESTSSSSSRRGSSVRSNMWQIEWFDNERDANKRSEEIMRSRHGGTKGFHKLHCTNPDSPHGGKRPSWASSAPTISEEGEDELDTAADQKRILSKVATSKTNGSQRRDTVAGGFVEPASPTSSRRSSLWVGWRKRGMSASEVEVLDKASPIFELDDEIDPNFRRNSPLPGIQRAVSDASPCSSRSARLAKLFGSPCENSSQDGLIGGDFGCGGDESSGISRKLKRC
jgi:hypothetical protein